MEDLIQESMTRGEFDNLSGAGKPLQNQSYNPHIDFMTQKMNEILIENGFTPQWITMGREIEEDIAAIRKDLRHNIHHKDDSRKWPDILSRFEESTKELNKKIQMFNLIVPILNRQMLLFRLDVELKKAIESGPIVQPASESRTQSHTNNSSSDVNIVGLLGSLFKWN